MNKKIKINISIWLVIILLFTQNSSVLAETNVMPRVGNVTGVLANNFTQKIKFLGLAAVNNLDTKAKKKGELSEMDKAAVMSDSAKEKIFKLSTPVISSAKNIDGRKILFQWNEIPAATSYEFEIDGNSAIINSNSFVYRAPKGNNNHTYRIRAKNEQGVSEWSAQNSLISSKQLTSTINDTEKQSSDKVAISTKSMENSRQLTAAAAAAVSIGGSIHFINKPSNDWYTVDGNGDNGVLGQNIEFIKLNLNNAPGGMRIKYKVYVQDNGWQNWVYDGTQAGMQGKQIQAIQIQIDGLTYGYDVNYLLCNPNTSTQPISKNGQISGTIGQGADDLYIRLVNVPKTVIDKDTHWTKDKSPYLIQGELLINQGVQLQIDPGVKVVFDEYKATENGIEVNGKLVANGTKDAPVIFTYSTAGKDSSSFKDNYENRGIIVSSVGEFDANYINMTENNVCNQHIDNRGILKLTNSYIANNENGVNDPKYAGGIYLSSLADATIDNTTISNCANGIIIDSSSKTVSIRNSNISSNWIGILISNITGGSSTINIDNNKLDSNSNAIQLTSSQSTNYNTVSIENNTISNSKSKGLSIDMNYMGALKIDKNIITGTNITRQKNGGPIYVYVDDIRDTSHNIFQIINPSDSSLRNNLSGNNYDAIVLSGTFNKSSNLVKGTNKYVVDNYLGVAKDSTLGIESGTNINIYGSIGVFGTLTSVGTKDSHIIYTALNDPTYGAKHTAASSDKNRDNNFDSIIIEAGGNITANYSEFRYGGRNSTSDANSWCGTIQLKGKANLSNCTISNSLGDGIDKFSGGSLTMLYSNINNSQIDGISDKGQGSTYIEGSTVSNSKRNGIWSSGNLTVINSTIDRAGTDGIYMAGALNIVNSKLMNSRFGLAVNSSNKPTIKCNSFKDNSNYGLINISKNNIDATYNYWNNQYGPSICNSDTLWQWVGYGDKIDNNVNYKPYLGVEYKADLGSSHNDSINTLIKAIEKQRCFGTPGVNAPTGNYTKVANDIQVKFADNEINLGRTYNSLDNSAYGLMGKGWKFSFKGNIKDYTGDSNTKAKIVSLPNGNVQAYLQNSDGTFTALDSRNKLVKKADGTYQITTKDQHVYNFDSKGNLTWMQDKNKNTVYINYDSNTGLISSVSDDTGRTFMLSYSGSNITGIVETIKDDKGNVKNGRRITYTYSNGLLSSEKDSLGNTTYYFYDNNGLLKSIKDNNNNVIENITYYSTKDSNNNKINAVTDVYGNTHTYTYDNQNRITTEIDTNNRKTQYWYDDKNYVICTVYPDGTFENTIYNLDNGANKYGEVSYKTDRMGNTTEFDRDNNGNIIKQVNPDLSYKEFTFDNNNNLKSERDENGNYTYYGYDSLGINLIKTIKPLNGTDQYNSNSDQSKFAVITNMYYSESERTQFGYKVKGLLKEVTDPEGNITKYTYDHLGNVSTVTNGEGKVTANTYNEFGLKTAAISPSNYKTSYTYNKNGQLESTVLNSGETTRTVYDIQGRKLKEISANLYNPTLEDTTNGTYKGSTGTIYEYYPSGKVKSVTDAAENITKYTYDLYGNIKTEEKPNGAVYVYEYEAMNRNIKTSFKENENAPPVVLEENIYTLDNHKLQKTQKQYISDSQVKSTIFTYNYANKVIKKVNPDNTVIQTQYYPNGAVSNEIDEIGNATQYKYDALNRLVQKLTPAESDNGITKYGYTAISYDKCGNKRQEKVSINPVKIQDIASTTAFITKDYTYYKDGKLKTLSDNEGRKTNYYYDNDGILSKEENYSTSTDKNIIEYKNNYFGKCIQKTVHIQARDLQGNNFNDVTDKLITTTYTYDKNGNLKTETNGKTTSYEYDNLNRPTKVSSPGVDEYGKNVTITASKKYDWQGNVLQETDANNNTVTYVYDKRGFLQKKTDPKGGIYTYDYDRAGRKLDESSAKDQADYQKFTNDLNSYYNKKSTDQGWNPNYDLNKDGIVDIYDMVMASRQGSNKKAYSYDSMDRVKTETNIYRNPNTLQWTTTVSKAYKYDSKGNVIKELDALGYNSDSGAAVDDKINTGYGIEYTYNLANKQITILKPASKDAKLSFTIKYSYDGLGRRVSETDSSGAAILHTYNNSSKEITKSLKKSPNDSNITILERNKYDLQDNLISKTDANGNVTTFEYNSLNKLRKEVLPQDASIPVMTTQYQYDTFGNQVFQQDNLGKTITCIYDLQGRKISESGSKSDGSNKITLSYKYDKNGNKRFETNGNGVVSETLYDEFNKVKQTKIDVKNSNNEITHQITTYKYDANENLICKTDWLGNNYNFVYDPLNRLVQSLDPYNKVIQKIEYLDNGLKSKNYDALNNVTQYQYDKNNRLIKTIDPEQHVTSQIYDDKDNIKTKTDGNNNTTKYNYDELNRLICVVNAKNENSYYGYDLNGNQISQVDGAGNTTLFEYNAANKLTRKIYPGGKASQSPFYVAGKVESYTYYADGNIKTKTDRNGKVTNFNYDIHGRLIAEGIGSINNSYTYDNNGNQLTINDSTGTTIRTYDELNRVKTKNVPNMGVTTYVYDITPNVPSGCYSEKEIDPKGNVTLKVFDKAARLQNVISDGNTSTYNYYDNGSKKNVIYPNGSREEYTYNKNNSLVTLVNKKSDGTIINNYSYSYDNANNQIRKIEGNAATTYTYDELNRIKDTIEPNGKTTTYNYDKAGNRAAQTIKDSGKATVLNYNYDNQNRLTLVAAIQNGQQVQKQEYTYDNNGNQIKMVQSNVAANGLIFNTTLTLTNKYDELNRLVEATTKDGKIAKYTYNGEGLRVGKDIAGDKTAYLYDGDKIVLELDGSGQQKARNVYGTSLISRQTGGEKAYYFYNGNGDVVQLINGAGKTLNSYDYDTFGNVTKNNETVRNPFKYAGYQYDNETGSYYLGARMYDPSTARFMQEDTYEGDPNDPLSLNLYAYCGNRPLTYYDPTGHFWKEIGSFIAGAASGAFHAVSNFAYNALEFAGTIENKITGTNYIDNFANSFNDNFAKPTEDWLGSLARDKEYFEKGRAEIAQIGTEISQLRSEINQLANITSNKTLELVKGVDNVSQGVIDGVQGIGNVLKNIPNVASSVINNPDMLVAGIGISLLNNSALNLPNITGLTNRIESQKLWELQSDGNNQGITAYNAGKMFGDLGGIVTGGLETVGGMAFGAGGLSAEASVAPLTMGGSLVAAAPTAALAAGITSAGLVTAGSSAGNLINDARSTFSYAGNGRGAEGVGEAGIGEYGDVGGHHIHAKAGFKGDINYDPNKGFSISQDFMKNNGWNHSDMTIKQRQLFKELYESGRPNTLEEHTRIAKEALKAGGATEAEADELISKSLENLKEQGVTQPTRIPWYSK